MIGAIAGDIIGSVYEAEPIKFTDFPLFSQRAQFTDDTVCTLAIAAAILDDEDYGVVLKRFGRHYTAGYGASFYSWLHSPGSEPYNSWGNGSAMRVSPVAWAYDDMEKVLCEAERTAAVTHNHPEGIKGAQAVACAILLARQGTSREDIRREITERFGYALGRTVEEVRQGYRFDVTCAGSVPESIISFLDAESFETAVRNAVSLGGDADTQACIAGSIAEAAFGIPESIETEARSHLPAELNELVDRFRERYPALGAP